MGASAKKIDALRSPITGKLLDGSGDRLIGGYSAEAYEKPLHFYQEYAHDWQLKRLVFEGEKGAGLFLDPGLGKTRITLTLIDSLIQMGVVSKVLIVAPLRPIYTVWPAEVDRWGFRLNYRNLHTKKHKLVHANDDIDIDLINYAGLRNIQKHAKRWDMLVLDESTYIKTWQGPKKKKKKKGGPSKNRAQFIRDMLPNIAKRVILTGTPAANSLADLHSQMFVVDDGESLGRTVTQFRASFCYQGGWQGRQWMILSDRKEAIHEAISDRVLRMKAEDFLDMPSLVTNDIWVQMPEKPTKQYKKLKRELYAELSTGNVFAINASSAYAKCRQFASGQIYATDEEGNKDPNPSCVADFAYHVVHREKFKALDELVESLNGNPLLVFYWFKHELAELMKRYKKAPVIRGGLPASDAMRIIDEWNADKHNMLICQWQAASHGLNMQKGKCADIACLSLTDSPEGYEQAYRRVYRQGVEAEQIRIHRILTRGTSDELQIERMNGKFETQSAFLEALKEHAGSR